MKKLLLCLLALFTTPAWAVATLSVHLTHIDTNPAVNRNFVRVEIIGCKGAFPVIPGGPTVLLSQDFQPDTNGLVTSVIRDNHEIECHSVVDSTVTKLTVYTSGVPSMIGYYFVQPGSTLDPATTEQVDGLPPNGTGVDTTLRNLVVIDRITAGQFVFANPPAPCPANQALQGLNSDFSSICTDVGVISLGPDAVVTKIIAGSGVTISPTTGKGDVTINAVGGGLTGSYNLTNQITTLTNGSVTAVGPPYAITSFSCTAQGTFEVGFTSTNPNTCTVAYANGTTASATLSDGTHNVTLTTPFTSGNLAFAYSSDATFSVSATATNTQTSGASVGTARRYCTFSGLSFGASPAGATASGSGAGNQCASETSTLAGGLGTLSSNGLGSTTVGQVFAFSNPAGNYITLLLTEGGTGCSRNPFTFNGSSPVNGNTHAIASYTNIIGGTQSNMCLYTFGPYSSAVTLTVAH